MTVMQKPVPFEITGNRQGRPVTAVQKPVPFEITGTGKVAQ